MAVEHLSASSRKIPAHELGGLSQLCPKSDPTYFEFFSSDECAIARLIDQEERYASVGERLWAEHGEKVSWLMDEPSVLEEGTSKARILIEVGRICGLDTSDTNALVFWVQRVRDIRKRAQAIYEENIVAGIDSTPEQDWDEAVRQRAIENLKLRSAV